MSDQKPLMLGELDDVAADAARRAAPVFKALGWTWRDVGVPDAAQIAASVRGMLVRAGECRGGSVSSGRLSVSRWFEEGEEKEAASVELQLAGPWGTK